MITRAEDVKNIGAQDADRKGSTLSFAQKRLVLQPDFVTWRDSGLDTERPPLDDHGL